MPTPTLAHHHGPLVGQYNDYRLISCEQCRFIHVDPLPSDESLAEVYDEKFYGEDKPDYLTKLEKEQDYWCDAVYRDRFDALETLVLEPAGARRKILDIGCSGGFFLRYGQERGWDALGIEPSRQAATYARKVSRVNVIQGYFQHVDFTDLNGTFDAVHLRNVLEHLPNPIELCERSLAALKPGGILCLEVPNDFNPLQKLIAEEISKNEYWVSIPHHLNYFTPETLDAMLIRLGFTPEYKEASFPIELFLLMGENYLGNSTVGASCHARRMQFEQTMNRLETTRALRRKLYAAFAELGMGRTMVVYARKPVPGQP